MSTHTPILHHYAFSTFSEKVRTVLGFKKINWQSVDVPGLPPRPFLSPLTGGYRRIPILQIGADIYCDTNIILPALDRLFPNSPTLYPAGSEGVARGLSFSWERQMWIPTIGILVHYIGEHIPPEFLKDRKEAYLMIDISKEAMAPQFEHYVGLVRSQYAWLAQALAQRPYVLGDAASAVDFSCWQTIFLLRKNCPPEVDSLLGIGPDSAVLRWYDRIAAFGHGSFKEVTPQDALEAAKMATPEPVRHIRAGDGDKRTKVGARVTVTPDDNARVPVTGILLAADDNEIIIRQSDNTLGDIHIHFPSLGFDLVETQ